MTALTRIDEYIHAARRGDGIHKWVNDKTPGADLVVLTDATLYYNIPEGRQVLIYQIYAGIQTVSDSCHFEIVSCTAVAGGGTPTAVTGHYHIFTGANLVGTEDKEREFTPPIIVKYSDGARSISIRVDANDASAEVSCGWMGIVEDE